MEHLDHPSPQIKDKKWRVSFIFPSRDFINEFWGVGGVSVPCYSVRDSSSETQGQIAVREADKTGEIDARESLQDGW